MIRVYQNGWAGRALRNRRFKALTPKLVDGAVNSSYIESMPRCRVACCPLYCLSPSYSQCPPPASRQFTAYLGHVTLHRNIEVIAITCSYKTKLSLIYRTRQPANHDHSCEYGFASFARLRVHMQMTSTPRAPKMVFFWDPHQHQQVSRQQRGRLRPVRSLTKQAHPTRANPPPRNDSRRLVEPASCQRHHHNDA